MVVLRLLDKNGTNMLKKNILTLLAAVLLFPADLVLAEETLSYEQEIEAYRERRLAGLRRPTGWLTLVGLHWLEPGENSVGSADDNDIVLGGGPENWGTVKLHEDQLHFTAANGSDVSYGDGTMSTGPLIADTQGDATVVTSGTLSFYVIDRGSYGLRVKDSDATALKKFEGLDFYPIDSAWRIEADIERAEPGTVIQIGNVLGQLSDSPVYGTATFSVDGKEHRLYALEEGSELLFFIIADRTNGRETYGAGRFLYTELPEDGKLIIDFNKVYNPPCAFNDYSTCPLPPPENRLNLRVTAGELNYHVPGLKNFQPDISESGSR